MKFVTLITACLLIVGCTRVETPADTFDVIIRNGLIYDGDGGPPYESDVGVIGDRIASIGDLSGAHAENEIFADSKAVTPGFINTLSWANITLIEDGRAVSDIVQGVTLEILSEGRSMGPLNEVMKERMANERWFQSLDPSLARPPWTSLGEFLEFLEHRGVSPNIASFVGAETVRVHVLGQDDRRPTARELAQMQDLVRESMRDGAVGVSSALAYTPGAFADTDELIALAEAAAEYDGIYASHIRSQAAQLLNGLGEFLTIAREANIKGHVYHLMAAGERNWPKFDSAVAMIVGSQQAGLAITSDMHPYLYGATTLQITTPQWTRDGGLDAFVARLQNPPVRKRIIEEMRTEDANQENVWHAVGPEGVVIAHVDNSAFSRYRGLTIAEVAADLGTSPEDAILDLLIAANGSVSVLYALYGPDNIRKKVDYPWMMFMSDSPTYDGIGDELIKSVHPRAYGAFARVLGRLVREEEAASLEAVIHRMTGYPADVFGLPERGRLREGYYADIAVFDPDAIIDHATYDEPHQLSTGVAHVFVNGVQVVRDGAHTGATPGRVVRHQGTATPVRSSH